MPSFAAAILSAGNLVLAFFVLPEPNRRTPTITASGSRIRRLVAAIRSPDIGSLVVAFFLASFAFSAFETSLSNRYGVSAREISPSPLSG